MTIINKAKYALVPLVMVCTTVNATTLEDQVKKIDEKAKAQATKILGLANNDNLKNINDAINALATNYTNKGAYELYEAINNALTAKVSEGQTDKLLKALLKIETKPLLEQIKKSDEIMSEGVTIDKGQPHNSDAIKPEGIIDTGGNKTTIKKRKTDNEILEQIMEVDTASTPQGLQYIQGHIKPTTDKTITKELLIEIGQSEMEITDKTIEELQKKILALKLNESDELINIITSDIHSTKLNELKAALKAQAKSLDPKLTADKNIETIIGKETYDQYKGVKRGAEVVKELQALYTKYKNVTGDDVEAADITCANIEETKQPKELFTKQRIEKLVNKADTNVKEIETAKKEISKLQAQITSYKDQEKNLKDQIKKYEDAAKAQKEKLEENKEDIAKIFGIKTETADTIEDLLDIVCYADINTIAKKNGFIPENSSGDNTLHTEITKLQNEIKNIKQENAKLKAQLGSNKGTGAGGLTDEDKGKLKFLYNNASGKEKGIMNIHWPWLKNDPVKPIQLPKDNK